MGRKPTKQLTLDQLTTFGAVIDPAGIVLSVNPAWRHILGWQTQEIVGQTTDWIQHPKDREKTQAELPSAAMTIRSW